MKSNVTVIKVDGLKAISKIDGTELNVYALAFKEMSDGEVHIKTVTSMDLLDGFISFEEGCYCPTNTGYEFELVEKNNTDETSNI